MKKGISPLALRIGGNIRRERMRRDFTRQYVADNANISAQYLSLAENGRRYLSMDVYIRIAAALQTELETLFLPENGDPAYDVTPQELVDIFYSSSVSERKIIATILSAIKQSLASV